MANAELGGWTQVEIDQTGNAFAAGVTISEENIMQDGSSLEFEENEDQTDTRGESPFTGQFANFALETDDWSSRSTIDGWRTGATETLVDVRISFNAKDGTTQTLTLTKGRARLSNDLPSAAGTATTYMVESRMFAATSTHTFD